MSGDGIELEFVCVFVHLCVCVMFVCVCVCVCAFMRVIVWVNFIIYYKSFLFFSPFSFLLQTKMVDGRGGRREERKKGKGAGVWKMGECREKKTL